jgi:hypothetical protein
MIGLKMVNKKITGLLLTCVLILNFFLLPIPSFGNEACSPLNVPVSAGSLTVEVKSILIKPGQVEISYILRATDRTAESNFYLFFTDGSPERQSGIFYYISSNDYITRTYTFFYDNAKTPFVLQYAPNALANEPSWGKLTWALSTESCTKISGIFKSQQEESQKRKDDAEAAAVAKAIAKRKAELQYQADAPARAAADAQAKVQAQIKLVEQAKEQAKAQATAEAQAKAKAEAQAQAEADAEKEQTDAASTISNMSDPVSGQIYVTKNKKEFTIRIETSRAFEVFKIVGKKKNQFKIYMTLVTDKEGNARVKKGLSLSGYKLSLIYPDTSAIVDSFQVK